SFFNGFGWHNFSYVRSLVLNPKSLVNDGFKISALESTAPLSLACLRTGSASQHLTSMLSQRDLGVDAAVARITADAPSRRGHELQHRLGRSAGEFALRRGQSRAQILSAPKKGMVKQLEFEPLFTAEPGAP